MQFSFTFWGVKNTSLLQHLGKYTVFDFSPRVDEEINMNFVSVLSAVRQVWDVFSFAWHKEEVTNVSQTTKVHNVTADLVKYVQLFKTESMNYQKIYGSFTFFLSS